MEWTEDDARQVLDEWRQSGQTIAAFARAHRMSVSRSAVSEGGPSGGERAR
jgi:hypothetical protein